MVYSSLMPLPDNLNLEPRACCVRNCPRVGDDHLDISQGLIDPAHEIVSVYWFCKAHQAVWPLEPTIVLETSRIETLVLRLDS
jgi:hypothetical protein